MQTFNRNNNFIYDGSTIYMRRNGVAQKRKKYILWPIVFNQEDREICEKFDAMAKSEGGNRSQKIRNFVIKSVKSSN